MYNVATQIYVCFFHYVVLYTENMILPLSEFIGVWPLDMAEITQLQEKLSPNIINHMKIDEKTLKRYLKAFQTVDAAYEVK